MNFVPKFPWFPNIEIFIVRRNIFKHIKKSTIYCKGKFLDVGCGVLPYRTYIKSNSSVTEYIGMDLINSEVYASVKPDLLWDGYHIPLEDNSIDTVMLTEVLEHCPDPQKVLLEINRVIKVGGYIVFSVPFLWYLHESPSDYYRYTPFAIRKMFEQSGYSLDVIETYGSNDLSFLHSYFIWLKKSSLPKPIRFFIYLITLPFILLFLACANGKNRTAFGDGQIFIGSVGVAKKI